MTPADPRELRLVIAEDHPVFRDGLRRALTRETGLTVVGEASDGLTALDRIRTLEPDVAILDVGLPVIDGCEVARRVRAERLAVELVFLTVCDEPEIFDLALELEVKGYLLKDSTAAEIVRCVRAVAAGQHFASPAMTTYLVERSGRVQRFSRRIPGLDELTAQERLILRRVAQERRSKEIAAELGISPKTVDAHRASICQKLGLRGNHALSRFAVQRRGQL
jgi:two-component system nitrate/nitrite response regulator NarL